MNEGDELYVNLVNFKKLNGEYRFGKGVNLFKGDSGSGKSTVVDAIKWCLFSSSKNVYPKSFTDKDKKKKEIVKVEVRLAGVIINRSKLPELVTITLEDKTYVGEDAQNIINDIFFSKDVWQCLCFVSQDERNKLMNGTKSEKLEMVKSLIFDRGGLDENLLEEKLDSKIKESEYLYKNLKNQIDVLTSSLERDNENNIKEKKEWKKLRKIGLEEENISELKEKLEKLRRDIQYNKDYDKFIESKQNILNRYNTLSFRSHEECMKFRGWVEKRDIEDKFLKDHTINFDIDININYSKELFEKEKICEEIKKGKEVCKEAGVGYNSSLDVVVDDMINKVKLFDEYETWLIKKNKLDMHLTELKNVSNKIEKSKLDIENIKQRFISHLKVLELEGIDLTKENIKEILKRCSEVSGKALICPGCKTELIIDDNKLRILNFSIDERMKKLIEKECKTFNDLIDNLEDNEERFKELNIIIQNIKDTFNDKDYSYLKNLNKKNLETNIKKLKNIKFIGKDENELVREIKNLRRLVTDQNNMKIYKQIRCERLERFETLRGIDLGNEIKTIQEYNTIIEEKNYIERKNIDEREIQEIEKKISLLERKDMLDKLIISLNNRAIEINNKIDECEDIEKKLERLNKLKLIISKTINETIKEKIDCINELFNEILSKLFDDLKIEICMFKYIKASKILKPEFNMKIILEGNVLENINELSGGEKDRVSIALTMTMNILGGGKVVVFDESLSSLDSDMRGRCVDVIKEYLGSKIVINICHDTIEGCYDNVIHV